MRPIDAEAAQRSEAPPAATSSLHSGERGSGSSGDSKLDSKPNHPVPETHHSPPTFYREAELKEEFAADLKERDDRLSAQTAVHAAEMRNLEARMKEMQAAALAKQDMSHKTELKMQKDQHNEVHTRLLRLQATQHEDQALEMQRRNNVELNETLRFQVTPRHPNMELAHSDELARQTSQFASAKLELKTGHASDLARQERALREDAMVEQAQLIAEAEQLREQQKGSDERLETMLAKQEDRLLATHNRNDALKDAQHASTLTQALNTQSMRHTATRNQERALSGANHKQAMASATLRHNSEMDDQADAHTRDIERQALRMREENERSLAELQSRANRSNEMQEARFSQQLAAQAVEHAQDMATRDCEHFETRDREFREREAQHAAALASQQEQRFAERLGQSSTRVSGDDVDKQTKAVRQSSELFAAMDVLACCVEAVSDEKLEVSMWSRGFKTRTGCEVSSRQPVATLPFRSELDATLFGQLVRSALHVADAGTLPETFIGFESLNSSALALKMTVACHSQSNVLLVGTEIDPGLLSLRPSNEAHWDGADTAASESRGSLSLFAATASQSGSIVDTASEARPNFIPDEARSTREIPVAAPDPRLQTTRFRGHTQGRLARSAYDRWGDTRSLASWETPPHALSRPVRRGPQTQHPELRPHAARAIQKLWRHRRPNLLYPKSYSQAALVLTPIVADESLAALSGCVACFLTGTPVADRIE